MKRWKLILVLFLWFLGCKIKKEKEIVEIRGGSIVIGVMDEPKGFNPLNPFDFRIDGIDKLVFCSLFDIRRDGKLEPKLATHWYYSEDLKKVRFFLRKEAKWWDGKPVTSDDFIFTYQLAKDPKIGSVFRYRLGNVKKVVKINDKCFEIIFKRSYHNMLLDINIPPLPKHIIEKMNLSQFSQEPMGNGAFKLIRWERGRYAEFAPNEFFFGKKPNVERLFLFFYADFKEALRDLREKRIDMLYDVPSWMITEEIEENFKVISYPSDKIIFAGFNLNKVPSITLRKAIAYGIDKKKIKNRVFKGYANILQGFIPPHNWAYEGRAKGYDYLPHNSIALMKSAGLDKEKIVLRMLSLSDSLSRMITESIKEDLEKIGVTIQPFYSTPSFYIEKLKNRDFDMVLLSWNVGFALQPLELWHSSPDTGIFNFTGFKEKIADSLMLAAFSSFNWQKAKEVWGMFNYILLDRCPAVFLVNPRKLIIKRKELFSSKDFSLENAGFFWMEKRYQRRYELVSRIPFVSTVPETLTLGRRETVSISLTPSPSVEEILKKEKEKIEKPKDTLKEKERKIKPIEKYTPPQLIKRAVARYPSLLKEIGFEGVAVVEVRIDENGNVVKAKIIKSSGNSLCDSEALEAAKKSKFSPAKVGDKPVPSRAAIPYKFVP